MINSSIKTEPKNSVNNVKKTTAIVATAGAIGGAAGGFVVNNMRPISDHDVFEKISKDEKVQETMAKNADRLLNESKEQAYNVLKTEGDSVFNTCANRPVENLNGRLKMLKGSNNAEIEYQKKQLDFINKNSEDEGAVFKRMVDEKTKSLVEKLGITKEELKNLSSENLEERLVALEKVNIKNQLVGKDSKIIIKGLDEAKNIEELSKAIEGCAKDWPELINAESLKYLKDPQVEKTILSQYKGMAQDAAKNIKRSSSLKYAAIGAAVTAAVAGGIAYLTTKNKKQS